MFGLFKKVIIEDPRLGAMQRHGRRWAGEIALSGCQPVELDIEGTKEAPHPETLTCAYQLHERLPSLIPIISKELLEHLEPYRDAIVDPDDDFRSGFADPGDVNKILSITSPELAWAASKIVGVEIGLDVDRVILLIKIDTLWDLDHTLGAYFEDWKFQLLNGSI